MMIRKNKRKFQLKKPNFLIFERNLSKSRADHRHQLERISKLSKKQKDLNLNIQ